MIGTISPSSTLLVKDTNTKKGRGVFSKKKYKKGDIVEECPILLINEPWEKLPEILRSFVYDWGYLCNQVSSQQFCIALGMGSLFNHDNHSLLNYFADNEKQAIVFRAKEDINENTELTINYNDDIPEGNLNWFQSLNIEQI